MKCYKDIPPNMKMAETLSSIFYGDDSEVEEGAICLHHFTKKCGHCETTDTPLWRKGWYEEILGKFIPLCNAEGLRYNKQEFCYHCNHIYKKRDVMAHLSKWIQCVHCESWTHRACETDVLLDYSYLCPRCVQ